MNRFLFEKFPNAYGRIYKAILQNKGKDLVPEIFKSLDDVEDMEKFMESQNLERLSHDVYVGLRDIIYIKRCGYADLISHLFKKNYGKKITNEMDAVVLQINESQRWHSRYKSTDKQYDLILGIPRWSRVVTLSTSDISPSSLVTKINQFDTIRIENYHFYEIFNKLHGVNGRNVTLLENNANEKAKTFSQLNFLFRTTEDIKTISHSSNLRLFTLIPDVNGLARVGFYFSMVGKVIKINDVLKKDGTGIDPYSYMMEISDDFSTLKMNLSTENFIRSSGKLYLANEINRHFGSMYDVKQKFDHPSEMVNYNGYVLLMGMWFLGDDLPGISYIIPLNDDINYLKYQILGFMNTRRKQSFQSVRERWEEKLEGTKEVSENLKSDADKNWAFFKEETWDQDIFQTMVTCKFQNPPFHKLLEMNISQEKFRSWLEYTNTYFQINEFIKKLYISENPDDEFKNAYPIFESKKIPEIDFEKEPNSKQIPNLILVSSWYQIRNSIIPKLKESEYTVNEIFQWGNGGKRLQNKTEKYFYKVNIKDEMISYLNFIHAARGGIYLPEGMTL